eukprot:6216499-Ditylum_brightwellii.AAC.1
MTSSKHILYGMNAKRKTFDRDLALLLCHNWLRGKFAGRKCVQVAARNPTSCDCMKSFLQGAIHTFVSAFAEYMIHWGSMPQEMQLELLHEWIKMAEFVQGFGEAKNITATTGGGG